jgi:hypothetical protein
MIVIPRVTLKKINIQAFFEIYDDNNQATPPGNNHDIKNQNAKGTISRMMLS